MTEQEHIDAVKHNANALAESLVAATDAGVSQAILLPELLQVFRQSGLLGDGPLPFGLG